MKKIFLICVLILSLGLVACGKSSLPPLADEEKEDIKLEESIIIYGVVTEKLENDVLKLQLSYPNDIEKWGEYVYVITNDAEKWNVGIELEIKFSEAVRPIDSSKLVRIKPEHLVKPIYIEKPIIYFYPETDTLCSVKIALDGTLTATYPEYRDGWDNFIAKPDGTLVFPDGREYYALYWEGSGISEWDFSEGFCVKGEDTAAFLEWALEAQGLSSREANEFIIYWLPLMQNNPYNVISFQKECYTDSASLEISPAPDSLLRVFMAYYSSDTAVEIPAQEFAKPSREGFTVVEWGGALVE